MRVGTPGCARIGAVEYANAPALLVTAEGVTSKGKAPMRFHCIPHAIEYATASPSELEVSQP